MEGLHQQPQCCCKKDWAKTRKLWPICQCCVYAVLKKHIPQNCRTNYVSWLTSELSAWCAKYKQKFTADSFAVDNITASKELVSTLKEKKQKSWQNLTECLDMTHCSKKSMEKHPKVQQWPRECRVTLQCYCRPVTHQLLENGRVLNKQPKIMA